MPVTVFSLLASISLIRWMCRSSQRHTCISSACNASPCTHHYTISVNDECEDSLVDPWLHSTTGVTADVSQPADIFALPKSTYSPSHAVSSSTPLNDPSRHPRFVHTPGGSAHPICLRLASHLVPGNSSLTHRQHTDIPKICAAQQLFPPALARFTSPQIPRNQLSQHHA